MGFSFLYKSMIYKAVKIYDLKKNHLFKKVDFNKPSSPFKSCVARILTKLHPFRQQRVFPMRLNFKSQILTAHTKTTQRIQKPPLSFFGKTWFYYVKLKICYAPFVYAQEKNFIVPDALSNKNFVFVMQSGTIQAARSGFCMRLFACSNLLSSASR